MADIKNRREGIDLRNYTGGVNRNSNNSDSGGGKTNSNNNNNNNNISSANRSKNKHVKDNRSDENKIKSQRQTLKPNQNQKSTEGRSQVPSPTSTTSSNPQQKNILRNAVYYQNRFILLDSPSDATKTNSNSSTNMSQSHDAYDGKSVRMGGRRQQQKSNDGNEETSFSNNKMAERVGGNRKNMEMDASSVTMDARGIEIILTDPENSSRPIAAEESKSKNTWLKKINRVLLDNRVKGRNSEIILHRDNPEDNKVLKKVLNFIFLAIGAMLFLSVLICVIYAFAKKTQMFHAENQVDNLDLHQQEPKEYSVNLNIKSAYIC
ncbi:hypothetical protein KUTeg_000639 [Tegillarca granosa]|uniref:Uncharacterized protein n=1 Tax=Tegillarca granosa TaxID=220873 RepID=A0ABQ9G2G2_TEGGR|nr:hypothetical protein KUTeg_000639 [Tegillarca granosa]